MKNYGHVQAVKNDQVGSYYTDSGAANAYVVTLRPPIASYTAGLRFTFKATNANTGASTININGLGVKTIKKSVSTDLAAGDILAGQIVMIAYDGTNFQLMGSIVTGGGTDTNFVNADLTLTSTPRTHTFGTNQMTFTGSSVGAGATLNIANTSSGHGLISSAAGSGYGLYGMGFRGVYGVATGGGEGVRGANDSGIGVRAVATTGTALWIDHTPTTFNDVVDAIHISRFTSGNSGSGANGIGTSISFAAPTSVGSTAVGGGMIVWKWSTATDASRTGQFEWHLVNNAGGIARKAALSGPGKWTWDAYGSGTFTGTPAYYLTVDSSGNVIETTGTSTPGIDTVLAVGQSLSTNRDIPGAYNLSVGTGTLTVGATATVGAAKFYVNQTATGLGAFFKKDGFPTTGENSFGADFQRIVGSGTFGGSNSVVGGYGELGFNNGNFIFSGPAYTGLNGINGVVTIYPGGGSLTANNSIFAGGQYNLFLSGTGTVDKFACIRLLYPVLVPSQTFTGIITNHYGLYIDDTTASSNSSNITNRWGIYQQGSTDTNVFGSKKNSFGATGTPTSAVDITGATGYTQLRLRTSITPSGSADGAGNTGDWAWDDNFIYVKVSTGWKRSALSTF